MPGTERLLALNGHLICTKYEHAGKVNLSQNKPLHTARPVLVHVEAAPLTCVPGMYMGCTGHVQGAYTGIYRGYGMYVLRHERCYGIRGVTASEA